MLRTGFLIPASLLLLNAQGAVPFSHVTGSGEVVRRTITVEPFHGIQVEGAINVELSPASAQAVEVEAQENLVGLVTTVVRNGVWVIATKESYSTNKPFVVHIRVPLIDVVEINGSSDVKGDGSFNADHVRLAVNGSGEMDLAFAAKKVEVNVQGSGDVDITGSATELRAEVAGSGDIEAKGLRVEVASVSCTGSGDITVFATKRLQATISGSGDIVYGGDPATVDKSVDGSGEVRPIKTSGRL